MLDDLQQKTHFIDWLGFVPDNWNVVPLKFAAREVTQKLDNKPENAVYIGLEHIVSGVGRLNLTNVVEQVESSVITFQRGDVVFGKLRPYLAKAFLSEFDGVATSEVVVYRPGKGLHGRYLLHLMLSEPFIRAVDTMTYGAKMPRANPEQISALRIPLPSLQQQRAIAAYLDRETARIDALIAAKERLLDVLAEKRQALITQAVTRGLDPSVPLKDSGLPWIGKVPAHWAVPPIRARFEVQLGKMLDEKRIYGKMLAPYLRNVDVQWDRINTDALPQMDFSEEDKQRFTLRAGDILVCEGGDVGRCAIWHGELENCFYQKALHRLRPSTNSDLSEYFVLFMKAASASGVFTADGNASTIFHLPAEKLRNIRFPAPPLEEQQQIVQFVKITSDTISETRQAVLSTLKVLRERRTALIAAAVTGQIDVGGGM